MREERHDREQYFFDEATAQRLVAFLSRWEHPCCVCAPTIGERLAEAGHDVTILDVDERFAHLPGYRPYDVTRPPWIDRRFDGILCDPPFFNVSLSVLRDALRQLSHHDDRQPVLLGYLSRRADAVVEAFSRFSLRTTGIRLHYTTVDASERNEIELFSNLDDDTLAPLREP